MKSRLIDVAKNVLTSKQARMGRDIPSRRDILMDDYLKAAREAGIATPGRGAGPAIPVPSPGRLTGSLRPVPGDISKAQALGMTTAMGGIGGLGVSDLTEGFTESAKLSNSIFADPEELGRQAAKAKMTLQEIMDRARGKAEELGEAPQIYMLKIQSGYQDEMRNQEMSEPQRIYDEDQGMKPVSLLMAEGGEAQMPEMEMSEQEAMAELEGIAPQAQMIEQLIMAVIQMIQQGVSEAEVREFLKEQGLDDEDIEDLFMMVMQQIEQAPAEEPIGRELQGIM